jgi:hypothetical protein
MYAIHKNFPRTITNYEIKNPYLNSISFKKYLKIKTPLKFEKLPIVLSKPIKDFETYLTFVL